MGIPRERNFGILAAEDGCDWYAHCLECPLPACRLDGADIFSGLDTEELQALWDRGVSKDILRKALRLKMIRETTA